MNDDEKWRERIVIDPGLHHGEPCIKGTRVAVSVIVANLTEHGIEQNFIKSKARDLFFVAPDVGSAIEHI